MAYYIRLSDNFYPLTEREIRDAFPNTSFPQPFNPEGYAVVFSAPQPTFDPITKGVRESNPVLTIKGTWEQTWEVFDLSPEQIAENQANFAFGRMKACEAALELMLDKEAQERTWKDCLSARSAAGYPSSFQAEGIAFVQWWAACWESAHTILEDVNAGTRSIPTVEEFLSEMPLLSLPE